MASFPHKMFSDISQIELTDDTVLDFCVKKDGIKLECRLNNKINSNNYLVVTPNGAVDRNKYTLPVFARWNYHSILNSPILSISDPALFLDDNLRIGWFSGTKDLDITQFTIDVVEKVAAKLGIAKERIIFWGSSSGGFASILLASKIDGANFVCINGQSTIINFHKSHIDDYRKIFDKSKTTEELIESYPSRWSAIHSLQSSYDRGMKTKGVIVQNTVDENHYVKQYTPFCEHFNLPIQGGENEKYGLCSFLFDHEKGHGPETAEIAKKIVSDYFPKILDEN